MDTLESLKSEIDLFDLAIEGKIVEKGEEAESLSDLYRKERELRAEVDKLLRAIREKESTINLIDRDIAGIEREKALREVDYMQIKDKQSLEQGIADSIERRRDWAESQEFAWTEYAYEHQWVGALTLAHFGNAMLADEMGLGKTMTSIAYLDLLEFERENGKEFGAKKVLVLCPNDLVSEYTREFQAWAPHRTVIPAVGANATLRGMINHTVNTLGQIVVVANYESVWRDATWLSEFDWDAIVIDEFHNAKDDKGMTFSRLKEMNSKYFLPMTATFILNSPLDIFPALNLILPDTFADIDIFRRRYCQQNFDGKWTFGPGGESALMESVGNRMVKRTLADAKIELPQKIESEVLIPQSAISFEQKEVMEQIDNALIAFESESYPITAAIAQITRKRQGACWPAGIEIKMTEADYRAQEMMGLDPVPVGTTLLKVPDNVPSIKIDMAVQRLKMAVAKGKRAVVFSQFTTALDALHARLTAEGISTALYTGNTKKEIRQEIKRDFKRTGKESEDYTPKWDVVLCNYKTGGVGLTLTRATYMIMLDDEWNPGKAEQAKRRIWRIGQTEPVFIESFRIEKSVDEWMRTVIEKKQAIVDGLEDQVSIMESYRKYFNVETRKEVEAPAAEVIEAEVIEEEIPTDDSPKEIEAPKPSAADNLKALLGL